MSFFVIPTGTTNEALRTITFDLVDATDLSTPEDIETSEVKAQLSVAGAAPEPSDNDIVQVSAAAGEYKLLLTTPEVTLPIGTTITGWVQPAGCAKRRFYITIGAAALAAEPLSSATIVSALQAAGVTLTTAQVAALTRASFRAAHYADGYGVRRAAGDLALELVIPGDAEVTEVDVETATGRPTIIEAGAGVTP